jgi:HlyD family secretion protein
MSAIHGLNPSPAPAPKPDAEPVSEPRPWRFRLILLLALVGAGGWALYQFRIRPEAKTKAAPVIAQRTVRVTTGSIQKVLRLTGSTAAKDFASIAAPRMRTAEGGRNLLLMYLARSGAIVKKGEIVARIDTQAMRDYLDDLNAQIVQSAADVKRRKAEIAVKSENTQQSLRQAKASIDTVKLDSGASEIRTPIDAEELKLSLEEAQATYQEQLKDLASKKLSDTADLRVLEIALEKTIHERDRYRNDIERFTIAAPMSGLAVMQTIIRGTEMGQVQQGDQIFPGQPFMKIVDVSGMQVQASASQVETEDVRLGQPAQITFDAFPGLKLNAKVVNIGAMATAGSRANKYLRTVPVFLKILDHDNRVIPDLSTSSDVVVDESADALVIPLAAVEAREGKSFVRVKRGDSYEAREVKLGVSDHVRTAVRDGLREGEEIALGPALVASR